MNSKNPARIYTTLAFLQSMAFSLMGTVYMLFNIRIAKLDPLQLIWVGVVLEASVLIFEIPTGIVADIKSRRLSVLIGWPIICIGFLLMAVPVFPVILLANILYALGYTFISGAFPAWLSDELADDEKVTETFHTAARTGKTGGIIGLLCGIGLGWLHLGIPFIAGGCVCLVITGYLFLHMQETGFQPAGSHPLASVKKVIRQSTVCMKKQKALILLFLLTLLLGAQSEGYDRLNIMHTTEDYVLPLLFRENRIILISLFGLIGSLLSNLALKAFKPVLLKKNREGVILSLIYGIQGVLVACFAFAPGFYLAVAFSLLANVVRSLATPVHGGLLNRLIGKSEAKATLFSFNGQLDSVGQIAGGPPAGYLANRFGIAYGLGFSAVCMIPVIVVAVLAGRREKG